MRLARGSGPRALARIHAELGPILCVILTGNIETAQLKIETPCRVLAKPFVCAELEAAFAAREYEVRP